eukprot:TRINITY_DN430_c0_g1_i10.p1 TRINITY_DN430_c0_g1~~TRINITY_DN430_c0_g1_i10.p1  ORF type:complete len:583 (+),score=139.17 TRINITY_DN430_c0_g1_i10:61-1809(+)
MSQPSSLFKGRVLLLIVLMLWVMTCNADEDADHHEDSDHHEEGDHHHEHDHDHEDSHEEDAAAVFYEDFDANHDGNLELSEVYKSIDKLNIDGTCVMEEYTHRGFANGISHESENLHTLLLLLGAKLSTQTCNFGELHTEGKEEDLLDRLMLNFGDGVSVSGDELLKMWNTIVLNQRVKAAEENPADDHAGHNHARSQHVLAGHEQVNSRGVRIQQDDHAHAHAHPHVCTYSNNTILGSQLYQSVDVRNFVESFVLDVVEGCHIVAEECKSPSSEEVWGYSTMAVLIVTLVAVVTIVIAVPVMKYHHLLFEGTLAFAVGTLLGDAFLHILPGLLGGHNHGTPELNDYDKRNHMIVVLVTILVFYTIDWFCRGALGGKQAEDIVSVCPDDESCSSNKKPKEGDLEENEEGEKKEEKKDNWSWTPMSQVSRIVWVVVIADGVHNITDGLSIGAAFSTSNSLGLSTALASGFHEIPQEVADFAVLLAAGLSPFQAVVLNLLSGCSSIIACFIACAVGTSSNSSTTWFLAITVGSFVYLATGIVLPEVLHAVDKIRFKQLAVHSFGMILGALLMWIIAITEDHDDC